MTATRSIPTASRSPGARSAGEPLAIEPARPAIRATKPVQRDVRTACVDCAAPVIRARRARGPLPRRCPACRAARRPRAQLRAYLRSAARLAVGEGLAQVVVDIDMAIVALDAKESSR